MVFSRLVQRLRLPVSNLKQSANEFYWKDQHHITSAYCTASKSDGARRRQYNVGIVGAGRIASSVHIKNVLRNRQLSVKWIVDDSEEALSKVRDDYFLNDISFYPSSNVDKLLEDDSLDAVLVFTPTSTHADYICRSLNKGKHVLTEKPTGSTYDEIKLCYETAEKNDRILVTGYQRRFDPLFQDIWKAVREGTVGDIQLMKLTDRDSPKPSYEFLLNTDQEGCNIVSDLGVHDFDMMVWMTNGQQPESVYTIGHIHDPKLKSAKQPDTAIVTLKFKDGTMCTLDLSRDSAYGYDIRLEIFGSKGMASGESPRRSTSVMDGSSGAQLRPLFYSFPQRFDSSFEYLITHFVDCLDGSTEPLVTKEECLLVAKISEKAVQSFVEGKAVQF